MKSGALLLTCVVLSCGFMVACDIFQKYSITVAGVFFGATPFGRAVFAARTTSRGLNFEFLLLAWLRFCCLSLLFLPKARIIAMTCTHAALIRRKLVALGFKYDNMVMEESAQILEVETFIPMMLQVRRRKSNDGCCSRGIRY